MADETDSQILNIGKKIDMKKFLTIATLSLLSFGFVGSASAGPFSVFVENPFVIDDIWTDDDANFVQKTVATAPGLLNDVPVAVAAAPVVVGYGTYKIADFVIQDFANSQNAVGWDSHEGFFALDDIVADERDGKIARVIPAVLNDVSVGTVAVPYGIWQIVYVQPNQEHSRVHYWIPEGWNQ